MIGPNLSHFRILDRIGEGGMGVVYRAEDENLHRVVALKVLRPERLADEEHRLRFVREARTAAAVAHPNIATVHEIDEADGVVFIAMELVEGRTLGEVIGGRPLPLREALRLGVEIAEGLAAAHRVRVVHRDLKPENVIVTPDGRVKVLDFGLAKLLEEPSAIRDAERSRLATISDEMTQAGRVMGTAAYMSPEQARGLPVDERSDVFSFGIVLYEMVTGKRPFRGTTSMDTLTAILREQPVPPVQLNPEVPAELEWIITKCLEKEPGERYQDTRDLAVDLRRLRRESDSQPMARAEPGGSRAPKLALARRVAVLAAIALTIGVLAVIGYGLLRRGRVAGEAVAPFETMRMERLASVRDLRAAALSPDKRFLAYVSKHDGKYGLWIRQISTGSDIQILPPQDSVTSGLAFSMDGEHLYYLLRDPDSTIYSALHQVPTLGGTPRKILFDVDSAVAFSPDGKRIAFMRGLVEPGKPPASALMIADADGSEERALAVKKFPGGFDTMVAPTWSPDGEHIAAAALGSEAVGYRELVEVRVADGAGTRVGTKRWGSVSAVTWLPERGGIALVGSEVGESIQQIWSVAVPGGEARRITNDPNAYVGLSVSADGSTLGTVQVTTTGDLWIAPAGDPSSARRITSGEGAGKFPGLNTNDFSRGEIAASPSGSILFEATRGGSTQIRAVAPDGTDSIRLTPDGLVARAPLVAHDTGTVLFTASGPDRVGHVFKMDADGGGLAQLTHGAGEFAAAISPDGRSFAFGTESDVSLFRAPVGGGAPEKIVIPDLARVCPRYSLDSEFLWLATVKERGGRAHLGLEQFPAGGGPSVRRIEWPRPCDWSLPHKWSPSGDELVCIGEMEGVYNLWSQPIAGGEPRPVSRFKSGHVLDFDWSTDGKQLLLWRGDAATDVVLITNFR